MEKLQLKLLKKMYLLEVYKNKLKILSKTFNHEEDMDLDQYRVFMSLNKGIINTMDQIKKTVKLVRQIQDSGTHKQRQDHSSQTNIDNNVNNQEQNKTKVGQEGKGEQHYVKLENDRFLETLYKMFPDELSRKQN